MDTAIIFGVFKSRDYGPNLNSMESSSLTSRVKTESETNINSSVSIIRDSFVE